RNATWTLSYKGRLDSDVEFDGWAGFAVGNPANTPGGAGFAFNIHSNGTYRVWTNGILVAEYTDPYSIAGLHYDIVATFNEASNTVQLTYWDALSGDYDMGTYPTAFVDGHRFVELRNHVDSSSGDGIVDMRYDDLAIDVLVSKPPYPAWAQEHSLSTTNALFTADTDGDGFNNLLEYALGMDPNVFDTDEAGLSADFSLDWLTYVHPRRYASAASGLDYELAYKTNLLDAAWLPLGHGYETGTNAIDGEFEAITNEIPITGVDQAFLHLEIRAE
ncbi:MAG: hypothetical protein ABFR33_10925, partial [Verrucomicrobiota bacterium]